MRTHRGMLRVVFVAACCSSIATHGAEDNQEVLTALSLEDLMQVEVVTASRNSSTLMDTPAAVYVITSEDIRRSGVTTIPDALRMAPGIDVARIDASRFAVSVRGFTSQYANKVLVMIDGRSVYKPLFAGTVWELQDMLLDDIDRIEVVRGPGASTWGANAVNGVINIVTKKASKTTGSMVSGITGTEETWMGEGRHGGRINENTYYRVYAKAFEHEGFADEDGDDLPDMWRQQRAGFRIDSDPSAWDSLSLAGEVFESASQLGGISLQSVPPGQITSSDVDTDGGHVLGTWSRAFSSQSKMKVQTSFEHTDRTVEQGLNEERDAFAFDAQHDFALGARQQVTWGLAANLSEDQTEPSAFVTYNPADRDIETYSTFIQDDVTVIPERLFAAVGTKLEKYEYSDDWELLPSARVLIKPTEKQSAWAAVSRAVRTPARSEHEGNSVLSVDTTTSPTTLWRAIGREDVESETMTAYELGYRAEVFNTVIFDAAAFYNDYDDLVSLEPGAPIPPAGGARTQTRPFYADNKLAGESYGGELSAQWQAVETWRLQAEYSYIKIDLRNVENGEDTIFLGREDETPQNQFSVRSSLDLARNVEWDVWVRYVDERPTRHTPDYTTLDTRVAWRPRPDLELALVGQNLLDSQHLEYGNQFRNVLSTEIERSVYGKATWWF